MTFYRIWYAAPAVDIQISESGWCCDDDLNSTEGRPIEFEALEEAQKWLDSCNLDPTVIGQYQICRLTATPIREGDE